MIHHGDLFDVLPTLAECSVDACVTDPPYGIGFMGKKWDTFAPSEGEKRIVPNRQKDSDNPNLKGGTRGPASSPSAVEYDYTVKGLREFQAWTEGWAREVYRVLKPGGYIVVCGAPRSYHRMACGLEDAGFVIRDKFAWLFGQGFPKSLNLGEGKGTALKPGHEPIALAWKPFRGTITACHEQHGTAALNLDACRIGIDETERQTIDQRSGRGSVSEGWGNIGKRAEGYRFTSNELGRWPANVLLDEDAAALLDEQTGEMQSAPQGGGGGWSAPDVGFTRGSGKRGVSANYADVGGASRFYYVAKPSREERDYGCDFLQARTGGEATSRTEGSAGLNNPRAGAGRTGGARNVHPTVKPVELMRWLVKLVTPIGGTVLDPFTGSGTTGMAAAYELRPFIGIEREAEYVAIAEARIKAVAPLFSEAV